MAGPNMKNKRVATPVAPQGKAKPASEKQGSAEKVAEQAQSEQASMSSKAPETAPVPPKAAEIRAPAATSARAAVEPQVASPAASRTPSPSAGAAPSAAPSRTPVHAGPAPRASIAFAAGWRQIAEGELVAGGQVIIAYDPERAQVRPASNGTPAWGVQGFVRLLPSGQVLEQPVIEVAHREAKKRPFTVDLPRGTTEIEVWFKNWSKAEPKEEWDSNFGKNYRFAVRARSN